MGGAEITYTSVVVLGELFAGFKRGKREAENIEILNRFLGKISVVVTNVTRDTAIIYGELKNNLAKRGTPIPTNDIWIAAQAVETGSVLISFDKHFLKIPGLRIWDGLKFKN